MVISVTPNPAVDETLWLDRLKRGEVNRAHESQFDPAGKGINVSRMVHRLDWPTVAFGFLAGETGDLIANSLDLEGVQHHFVRVPGLTRISFTVVETSSSTSVFGPGPHIEAKHRDLLDGILRFWLRASRVLVLAGSLPQGMANNSYAGWIEEAHQQKVQVILDAHDEPLRQGLLAGADLIKPNLKEASTILGRALTTVDEARQAAFDLMKLSPRKTTVVISMGAQGAICAQENHAWRAFSPPIERLSTVGSGDSMVAGLAVCMARGESILNGLRLGTAAGVATAMTPGTALGAVSHVKMLLPEVVVEQIC